MTTPAVVRAPPPRRLPGGDGEDVAPGIRWVRTPLPYALDHVNLWLLEERDGWSVVDTGHGDAPTREAWERIDDAILGGRPLGRVLCTHHHPDHIGLAGWMAERWGAELWCTRSTWLEARAWALGPLEEARRLADGFYRRAGVPEEELAPLLERCEAYPANVSAVPPSFRRLRDGDGLDAGGVSWRVVVGRGHASEHACLFSDERAVLISGDQVLPHITPNVSVWPTEPEAEPLSEYLETLVALERLPDDVLVLPSHGRPFRGLHRRLRELAEHHRLRLEAILAACGEAQRTAFEITQVLFPRDLDPHQTTFAVGEALAHLHHLFAAGRLRRDRAPGVPDRWVLLR